MPTVGGCHMSTESEPKAPRITLVGGGVAGLILATRLGHLISYRVSSPGRPDRPRLEPRCTPSLRAPGTSTNNRCNMLRTRGGMILMHPRTARRHRPRRPAHPLGRRTAPIRPTRSTPGRAGNLGWRQPIRRSRGPPAANASVGFANMPYHRPCILVHIRGPHRLGLFAPRRRCCGH